MQTLTVPASISKRKQACKSCRQRKKRCDGERPSCSLCQRWNIRCEYTVPGLRMVEESSSSNYNGTLLGNMSDPYKSPAPWNPTLPSHMADAWLDTFSGMREETALSTNYTTPVISLEPISVSNGDSSGLLFPDAVFPPNAVIYELVEIFFDKIYHVLPCFHKRTFMEQIWNGHIQTQSPLLLYSLLAVAAGFHPDPAIKARRKEWYEQAKLLYDITGRAPNPALRTIQAVMFLVYYAYTCGDFSACWLYIGKVWRQAAVLGMNRLDSELAVAMPIGLKDGAVNELGGYYDRIEWKCTSCIEKEECRRVLWILFMLDRNQSWPTGWPNAIDERQFKLDIPVADSIFQRMTPDTNPQEIDNVPFTRNIDALIASTSLAKEPLNLFHYLIIAHILLGRTSELIHTIHDDPSTAEYTQECEKLDDYVIKLRLNMPRTAASVMDAPIEDRGQVVWLNIILNTTSLLLHYRAVPYSDPDTVKDLFNKTVVAAKNTSQIIKDASRISIDLLLNINIAPSVYMACCVLLIHQRLENDLSLTNDIDLLELVFERMNDVHTVIGLKFQFALKRDRTRSREELSSLREGGYRGLLANCSKWGFVQEELSKLGLTIS